MKLCKVFIRLNLKNFIFECVDISKLTILKQKCVKTKILKEFIKTSVEKKDARPFKVAENITLMVIDPKTGKKASFGSKKTIIEVFKKKDLDQNNKNMILNSRISNNKILRFY